MREKNRNIPVNTMANGDGTGISIERICFDDFGILNTETLGASDDGNSAHRHDSHSFFLLETGTVHLELDFQNYIIKAPSVAYVHPDQVHCTTTSANVIVSCLAITNENLQPEYLKILEDLTPSQPLPLQEETFTLIREATSLCLKFFERKDEILHASILKDSCNTLVALITSQYLALAKPGSKLSRFEIVTKTFREILEHNYKTDKRPGFYAQNLNISAPYLNECVKNATGNSVSYHIHQRIILEAKRLLFHTNQSVKEISVTLGYDDYPYFSRLFKKVTGITALAFRNKNRD